MYRIGPTSGKMSRWFTAVALAGLIVAILFSSGWAQESCDGVPGVDKTLNVTRAEAGKPVKVSIIVDGCSQEVDYAIPFDGALLIDMSNSMDDDFPYSDPEDKRLDAAKTFVDCVAGETRLAIVPFSTDAVLLQGLTSDKTVIKSRLNDLYGQASGGTNIYDAIAIAHEHLIDNSYDVREKFIILLTDGYDNSGHTDAEFLQLLDEAVARDFRYLTIALGNQANLFFLTYWALATDGAWYPSPDAGALTGIYGFICDFASHQAKTRQIVLHEKLSAAVRLVEGSVSTDIYVSDDQIDQFTQTGEIEAEVGDLASGESRILRFEVTSDCLHPDSEEDSVEIGVDDPSSKISYVFGLYPAEVDVPNRSYWCIRPGVFDVEKAYDIDSSILSIRLISNYLPQPGADTIRNIVVVERPSFYFEPVAAGIEPQPQGLFPNAETDALVWHFPALGPQDTLLLRIPLVSRVCADGYSPPIDVNAQKYTGGDPGEISYLKPDGVRETILMPSLSTHLLEVDQCDGRPDLYIEPEYTFHEYKIPPVAGDEVLIYEKESRDIWVDALRPNGLWDGASLDVGSVINGASISMTSPGASIPDRITVRWPSDTLRLSTTNRVYARVANTGSVASPAIPNGAVLDIYNFISGSWITLKRVDLPQIDPNTRQLISFPIRVGDILPGYLRRYALGVRELMEMISLRDPQVADLIRAWADDNPAIWSQFVALGSLLPSDLLELMPDDESIWPNLTPRGLLEQFLDEHGDKILWGKEFLRFRVVLNGSELEKHTNNNTAAEVVLVSP